MNESQVLEVNGWVEVRVILAEKVKITTRDVHWDLFVCYTTKLLSDKPQRYSIQDSMGIRYLSLEVIEGTRVGDKHWESSAHR